MKKFIIIALVILGVVYFIPNQITEKIIIPEESIRFRIIANSNKEQDQLLKNEVKTSLNKELSSLLKDSQNIEDSRNILKNNIATIENNVENTLSSQNKQENIKVVYGNNYFPQKEFKGVTYDAGEYESLVVTLGEGQGDNWWCVLFPPLCMLEASENDTNEVEYQLFIKKIIDKFRK